MFRGKKVGLKIFKKGQWRGEGVFSGALSQALSLRMPFSQYDNE